MCLLHNINGQWLRVEQYWLLWWLITPAVRMIATMLLLGGFSRENAYMTLSHQIKGFVASLSCPQLCQSACTQMHRGLREPVRGKGSVTEADRAVFVLDWTPVFTFENFTRQESCDLSPKMISHERNHKLPRRCPWQQSLTETRRNVTTGMSDNSRLNCLGASVTTTKHIQYKAHCTSALTYNNNGKPDK